MKKNIKSKGYGALEYTIITALIIAILLIIFAYIKPKALNIGWLDSAMSKVSNQTTPIPEENGKFLEAIFYDGETMACESPMTPVEICFILDRTIRGNESLSFVDAYVKMFEPHGFVKTIDEKPVFDVSELRDHVGNVFNSEYFSYFLQAGAIVTDEEGDTLQRITSSSLLTYETDLNYNVADFSINNPREFGTAGEANYYLTYTMTFKIEDLRDSREGIKSKTYSLDFNVDERISETGDACFPYSEIKVPEGTVIENFQKLFINTENPIGSGIWNGENIYRIKDISSGNSLSIKQDEIKSNIMKAQSGTIHNFDISEIKDIYYPEDFSFYIIEKTNNEIYIYGDNYYGVLGNGKSGSENNLQLLERNSNLESFNFIDYKIGENHILGLTNDGKVYSWGDNSEGQLGIGNMDFIDEIDGYFYNGTYSWGLNKPTLIDIPEKVIKIDAKGYNSAIITESNKVYVWGENIDGQLGLSEEDFDSNKFTPYLVSSILGKQVIISYFSGDTFIYILSTDSKVYRLKSSIGASQVQNFNFIKKMSVVNGMVFALTQGGEILDPMGNKIPCINNIRDILEDELIMISNQNKILYINLAPMEVG